ncbi:autotransporter outer membrane beta-barrel domain-containing protein [Taurinivorans muris]|uniref:Autotransporter outer membrane beta-barrel domain-containing protein n=1 Tax=Taurinivorans muris TaxID=2787751 RepID=A0ABY5Y3Q5_9BACT|nr:autotransporter outer membrane beta-barrel domain-containing protein [Desulfovibrionaceae bacterium LT0009]
MNQSKNALGNLKRRYLGVLKKCFLLGTVGTVVLGASLFGLSICNGYAAVWVEPGTEDITYVNEHKVINGDVIIKNWGFGTEGYDGLDSSGRPIDGRPIEDLTPHPELASLTVNGNITIEKGDLNNGAIWGNSVFTHQNGNFVVGEGARFFWDNENPNSTISNLTVHGNLYAGDLKTIGDTLFTKNSMLTVSASDAVYEKINEDEEKVLELGTKTYSLIGDGTSTLTIEDGAKLTVLNVKEGSEVTVVKEFGSIDGKFQSANMLQSFEYVSSADGSLTVKVIRNSQELEEAQKYIDWGTVEFIESVIGNSANVNDENAGRKYISRLFDSNFNPDASLVDAAKTIEENAQLSAVSGSAGTAVYAAQGASQNTMGRMGIGSSVQVQTVAKKNVLIADASPVPSLGNVFFETVPGWDKGLGVWFNPIYQNSRVRDMESGSSKAGYNANIGGASLGFDYTAAYNDKTDIRVGVQVHGGGGNSHSVDTISYASNDSDFIGGGIYAGVRREMGSGALYVAADLSYTATNNETEAHTNVGGIEADVDSNTFMAGLSAQYDINVNSFIVSPGIGVKYIHLNTDDYHSKVFGEAFFDTKIESQDVLSIPVSIGIAKNFILNNGWNISPSARLGVTFNAGDLDSDSISYLVGTNANPLSLSTTVLDDVVGNGTVGIQFGKNKISFGLDYSLDVSEHVTNHTVGAMVRYSF